MPWAKYILTHIDARLARHGKLGAVLVKGALGSAGIRLASAGINFLTAVVLAKLLGPSGYGTYAFVIALVAFFAIPSELGIPRLAVREIAATNARKEWGLMRGFIVRSHQAIGLLTIVLLAGGLVVLSTWGDKIDPVRRQCMWLGLIVVPLVSLGALRGAMLNGLRKALVGQLPEELIRPLVLLVIVGLMFALGRNTTSPVTIMGAHIGAATVAFLFGVYMFLKNRPKELSGAIPQYRTAVWLRSSIPFGLTALLQLINGRTDVLLLGIFREDAEVGIYRVAAQFSAMVIFGMRAINAIQGPHIAHLHAVGDMQRLQKMITQSSRATVAVALPMVLLFIAAGPYIIRAAFGEEFEASYVPMVILCIGQLVNASVGSVAWLLIMTGHEHDATRTIFCAAAVNVALNLWLTPIWGAIGAAVATATTLTVWNLIMWHLVRKRTGIEPSPILRSRVKR